MKKRLLFLALALVAWQAPLPALVHVAQDGSGDYTSIQTALDSTPAGETIVVTDQATYAEGLFVRNKQIISSPAGATLGGPVTVDGAGETTVTGFMLAPATNAPDFYIVQAAAKVTITSVTISQGDGIIIEQAQRVNISHCQIGHVTNHALNVVGADTDNLIIAVDHTEISQSGAFALALQREATVTFTNSWLHNNGQAGVIITNTGKRQTGKPITFDATTVENNATAGLLVQRACDIELRNGSIINNNPIRGINWDGSTVDGGTLVVRNSQITGNRDGALYLVRNLTVTLEQSTFSGNAYALLREFEYAPTDPTQITMTSCTVANNTAFGLKDAAASTGHLLELTGNIFSGNAQEAVMVIGQAPAQTVQVMMDRNKISGTTSFDYNLVVLNTVDVGTRLVNNVLDGNRAGLTLLNSAADIYHNTFINEGIGLELGAGASLPVNVVNNVIDRVSAFGIVGAGSSGLGQLSVDYNLINGPHDVTAPALGAHNLTGVGADFVSPSATPGSGDYRLMNASPAINAGSNALAITLDLLGALRPQPAATVPDMGAYEEAVSTPVTLSVFQLQ